MNLNEVAPQTNGPKFVNSVEVSGKSSMLSNYSMPRCKEDDSLLKENDQIKVIIKEINHKDEDETNSQPSIRKKNRVMINTRNIYDNKDLINSETDILNFKMPTPRLEFSQNSMSMQNNRDLMSKQQSSESEVKQKLQTKVRRDISTQKDSKAHPVSNKKIVAILNKNYSRPEILTDRASTTHRGIKKSEDLYNLKSRASLRTSS